MKVYQSISNVAKDLAEHGIKKTSENRQQGFMFRGIDAVYNALSPTLARHGLVILPRITERTVTERTTQKGGVLFYVVVKAEFDFIAIEDGSKHTVITYGEAMDSGDKATNKAMSIAYKYAAFQSFCVPTEETAIDADAESHIVAPERKIQKNAPDITLKEFFDSAKAKQSMQELKPIFARAWEELKGTAQQQAAKEIYEKRKSELEAEQCHTQ